MTKKGIIMKIISLALFLICLVFTGCSAQKETTREEPPSPPLPLVKKSTVPDITIKVASLDLSALSRKIEKSDIDELATIIAKNEIDILTIQGITRYPDLKTRTDIVEELAASAEMRKVFGENINISGRQTGNAIFSTYPIIANNNTRFDHIRSTNFESALQAVIDCGVRGVVVVSTRIPDKASSEDQSTCIATLSSFRNTYTDQPIIITGNLPTSETLQSLSGYKTTVESKNPEEPSAWFSGERGITILKQNMVLTQLSQLVIMEFGIFSKPKP